MTDFDEILGLAKPGKTPKPKTEKPPAVTQPESQGRSPKQDAPWSDIEPPNKEPSVRLNVDIPISLNDALAAKARQLRKPKTELVRKLLEWALTQKNE